MAIETEDLPGEETGEVTTEENGQEGLEERTDSAGWTLFAAADLRYSPETPSEFRRGEFHVRHGANGHYRLSTGDFRVQLSKGAVNALAEADQIIERFFGGQDGSAETPKRGRK